ncbi:MAG TPA: DedA family protein, partial [Actinomycetes bacterium]|nr:DedA family protein [Actinomycetes bacterium]
HRSSDQTGGGMADERARPMPEAPTAHAHHSLRGWVRIAALVVLVLVVAAIVVHYLSGRDAFSLLDETSGDGAYLTVFLLVFADAICPIFPGETTLNAASTLAAQGALELGPIMLAGAAGAVIGDSALYWIARLFGARFQDRLSAAAENPKVRATLEFLGSRAPLLLIAGRYVPGVRFAVNATFGLSGYPYPSFLLWSAIGGTVWSIYTCGLAYLVGTALAEFPLASVIISGLITTAALAAIYVVARRSRKNPAASEAVSS